MQSQHKGSQRKRGCRQSQTVALAGLGRQRPATMPASKHVTADLAWEIATSATALFCWLVAVSIRLPRGRGCS